MSSFQVAGVLPVIVKKGKLNPHRFSGTRQMFKPGAFHYLYMILQDLTA
jgi:hypothetical protein